MSLGFVSIVSVVIIRLVLISVVIIRLLPITISTIIIEIIIVIVRFIVRRIVCGVMVVIDGVSIIGKFKTILSIGEGECVGHTLLSCKGVDTIDGVIG